MRKKKPAPYIPPPPPPALSPEEQLRHDVEVLLGAVEMEERSSSRQKQRAEGWIRGELGRDFCNVGSVAQHVTEIAEANAVLDMLRKVREWVDPIAKGFV